MLVAPTGVAAANINGSTIHSAFKFNHISVPEITNVRNLASIVSIFKFLNKSGEGNGCHVVY